MRFKLVGYLNKLGAREEKDPSARATRQKAKMALCNLKLALTTTKKNTQTQCARSSTEGKIIQFHFQFLLIGEKVPYFAHTSTHRFNDLDAEAVDWQEWN